MVVGALMLLASVSIALVLLAANVDWGRRLIERATVQFSGGQIVLTGMSGRFPDDLHIAHIELRDADALWLSADDVRLQWTPSRLVRNLLQVERLHAARVALSRLPARPPREETPKPFELPMRLDITDVGIDALDIGAPLAGVPASVRLQGHVRAASLNEGEGWLSARRLDAAGEYRVSGHINPASVKLDLDLDEPSQGLVAGLANLPNLGAMTVQARVDGPRNSTAMHVTVAAGPLHAAGVGTLDLIGHVIDLDVTADAPAMSPRSDLSWNQMTLQAHVHGPFERPDATGRVRIDEFRAGEIQLRSASADLDGNRGHVTLHAVLDRLRIPGPNPDVLRSSPIDLQAELRLDDARRPVTLALSHPLVSVRGNANTGSELNGALVIDSPALAPFAAIAGLDLQGRTTLDAKFNVIDEVASIELTGVVSLTGGASPLRTLVGREARLAVSSKWRGADVSVTRLQLDGSALRFAGDGALRRGVIDANWKMTVPDLAAVAPALSGRVDAQGRIEGPQDNLSLTADVSGDMGTHASPRGPIRASARFQGLPDSPAGKIDLRATIDGSPLDLGTALRRSADGSLVASIERASWKSAQAEGTVAFSDRDRLPQGRIAVRIAQLSDLGPWIGQDVQGRLAGHADLGQTGGHTAAAIELDAREASWGSNRIGHLGVTGRVDNPTNHANLSLQLVAEDLGAHGVTASARVKADGPIEALVLSVSSDVLADAPAQIDATATLNVPASQITLSTLHARYRDQTAQLLTPARVSFGDGLAVDRLRVGMQQAVFEAAGRVSPTLDLTASLRNVTPALVRTFVPNLKADGTASVEAQLSGTAAEPKGTIRVAGNGLRLRAGAGPSLPPATLQASAMLGGGSARVEAKLSGGSQVRLNANGTAPLAMTGPLDMHVEGMIDLTILNPILEVNGRRVKGQAALDVALSGSFAAPRVDGSAKLTQGEIQDYTLGAQLTSVEALVQAAGDSVRIASLTARAGAGSVSASGTIGLLATGRPVDLKLTAQNARALATDLLSADTDLDLTLRGQAATRIDLAGKVTIHRADINVPNALPPTVAVLDVRRPGQKAPPPPTPVTVVGLDLDVNAPQQIYVRGRGLNAEAGGRLHVAGTTAVPEVSGGFDMRRGTFDLGGTSLQFTSGKVGFNGTGLTQKIDPTLDFVAESTTGGITAKLVVTGYADAPRIVLTSVPEMPQDEILARLLFGTSVKQLTAIQVVQIATALVAITGTGGGFNPLLAAQRSLGLDRLSVGSTSTGATTVEAGRYVYQNVYVGAKQSTSGGTQAKVQVDLTKHLKVQATLGTGTTTAQGVTPDNDPGSSIGLLYQFEY
jgi:translocation and assembly module TamB